MANLSKINEESIKSSLKTGGESNGFNSLSNESRRDKRNELIENLKYLQSLLIGGQKRFKEYEAVTEYANFHSLKVLSKCKWEEIPSSEIPTKLSNLNDNVTDFLNKIYDNMRSMDSTVSRLRNDNEKLIDQLKILQITNDTHAFTSLQSKLDSETKTQNNTRSKLTILENEKKVLKRNLKNVSKEVDALQTELDELKDKFKENANENRKLKKEISDLKDKDDNENISKDLKGIQKLLKELSNDIKQNAEETAKGREDIGRVFSKVSAINIDRLVASTREKELLDQKYFEKSSTEMEMIRNDIEQLKESASQSMSAEDRKSFEELQQRESELNETISIHEAKISGMKAAMDIVRTKFEVSMENERQLREENEKLHVSIKDLKKENKRLEEDLEKRIKAVNIMKEKISTLNEMGKRVAEFEETKIKLDQSNEDNERMQTNIDILNTTIKERFDECENLKKENLRLKNEMENMKRLNFSKKMSKV